MDNLEPRLFIGLGNPGKEYAPTYHNTGAMAVTYLAREAGIKQWKRTPLFQYAKTKHIIFTIPTTYMNESGMAVMAALKFFNLSPEHALLFHDESDLPLGEYKIGTSLGSAGHKGVQSTQDALHTKEITRVRIGIREEHGGPRKKAEEFVLSRVSAHAQTMLQQVFQELKDLLEKT